MLRVGGLTLLLCLSLGCLGNRSKRIAAPKWNPESAADSAMQMDEDSDGLLSIKELGSAPGLKSAVKDLDVDGDKKLSREEVIARLEEYVENQTGLMEYRVLVRHKNRPLGGANVRFVPESFLGDTVAPASAITDANGQAAMAKEDQLEPFMQPGIYRVEISSDTVRIPEKYNVNTELGVEVAPFTVENQPSPMEFNLK